VYTISVIAFLLLTIKAAIQFYIQYDKNEIDIWKLTSFYILTPYRKKEIGKRKTLKLLANLCLFIFYLIFIIIIILNVFYDN